MVFGCFLERLGFAEKVKQRRWLSFSLCLGSAELVGQRRGRSSDFVMGIIVTQVTGIFVVAIVVYLTLRACLVQPAS